jgi:undecaprenyl-diphosphatase
MEKNKDKKFLYMSICLLAAFVLWTLLVSVVDVAAIGPLGSEVGFSTVNGFVHELTGANMTLYNITDWLGFVPFAVAFGFAVLGIIQFIKRKSLAKVDRSIIVLGVFYVLVIAVYIFFEYVVVNRRPVLIEGILEASYPSSTTMIVMGVMPTTVMQLNSRIKNTALRRSVALVIIAFTVFMVVGRLISGVHWITDIIGGALISTGLVMLYAHFAGE